MNIAIIGLCAVCVILLVTLIVTCVLLSKAKQEISKQKQEISKQKNEVTNHENLLKELSKSGNGFITSDKDTAKIYQRICNKYNGYDVDILQEMERNTVSSFKTNRMKCPLVVGTFDVKAGVLPHGVNLLFMNDFDPTVNSVSLTQTATERELDEIEQQTYQPDIQYYFVPSV